MSTLLALALFLISLAVTLAAARLFARRLDRLGLRFGLPEAAIGLLTALAADGPEISAALVALIKGAHSTSVGVLVGSNAFNFAAMLGLSGLLAGSVYVSRSLLLLEGVIGAGITLTAGAVLLGWISALAAAIVAACLLLPYLLAIAAGIERLAGAWPERHPAARVARALARRSVREAAADSGDDPTRHLLALVVLDVVLIVAGSVGMVQAALTLGDRWGVSRALLGMLILAPLTSVPNAVTGVRLGLAGRGAALVGETFNSNTINLAGGVIAPALFTTVLASTTTAKLQVAWLVAMTGATLALLARGGGIGRGGAAGVIAMYGGFVALQLA
jgi:cation:H+ antiporter